MFLIKHWEGIPSIEEPEKCDHLDFFHLNELPETTLQVQCALAALKAKVPMSFSHFEAKSIASLLSDAAIEIAE